MANGQSPAPYTLNPTHCGDYCVGNSIKDLVAAGHGDKIRVLTRYIGNIDDGTTLRLIIAENNLQVVE